MGRNNWFQFKQFKIIQERAAMKVGTDGVLLGAWVNVSHAKTILDIGAGTGVISIMLAQRSDVNTKISGIEIEKNAADEASQNAINSPWNERITIFYQPLQQFQQNCMEQFDLIVSNPPFFTNSQKSRCEYLAMAKHNHLLPLPELVEKSLKLLSPSGKFALILPVSEAEKIIRVMEEEGLFLHRITEVRPNNLKPPHRYLLEFGKNPGAAAKDILYIHSDDDKGFSEKYKTLTRDFYLNF